MASARKTSSPDEEILTVEQLDAQAEEDRILLAQDLPELSKEKLQALMSKR